MWEIENNRDVLCIDKDDAAEDFLCEAYGISKPTKDTVSVPVEQRNNDVITVKDSTNVPTLNNVTVSNIDTVLSNVPVSTDNTALSIVSDSTIIPELTNVSAMPIVPLSSCTTVSVNVPTSKNVHVSMKTFELTSINAARSPPVVSKSASSVNVPEVKSFLRKESLIDDLVFSDDESEDMAPLYSKLIIIAASRDQPSLNGVSFDRPDSSKVRHTVDASKSPVVPSKKDDCWVVVERLTQAEIDAALIVCDKDTPVVGQSFRAGSQLVQVPPLPQQLSLLSVQAPIVVPEGVKTINKEPRVIDTIVIDSDDNQSAGLTPERVTVDTKCSDMMPKSRQINIPRWPKPLFESLKSDKVPNTVPPKKTTPSKTKERSETKKISKEIAMSYDNLFNKRFNILGSGLKIGKKAALAVVEVEEETVEVIDLAADCVDEGATLDRPDALSEEDVEAEKWGKAPTWDMEDGEAGQDFEETNMADDDDDDGGDSNESWTCGRKKTCPKENIDGNNYIEIVDDDQDVEFKDVVETTRRRNSDRRGDDRRGVGEDRVAVARGARSGELADKEEFCEDDEEVRVITAAGEEEEEVWEEREGYVEPMEKGGENDKYGEYGEWRDEQGYEWRPVDPDEEAGRGKWFDVDKYARCDSPPRYCDLVENRVIRPPEETEIFSDRFHDLWVNKRPQWTSSSYADRFPSYGSRQRSMKPSQRAPRGPCHYPSRERSPYSHMDHERYHSMAPLEQAPSPDEDYDDTDQPAGDGADQSSDVWRRLIESKRQLKQKAKQQRQRNQTLYFERVRQQSEAARYPSVGNLAPGMVCLPPNGVPPSHPPQYSDDANAFFERYPHLFTEKIRGQVYKNHRAPVPFTPASPDPEMPADGPSSPDADPGPALNGAPVPSCHNGTYVPAPPNYNSIPCDPRSSRDSFTPASPDVANHSADGGTV